METTSGGEVFCNGYDSFVDELSKAMRLDERRIMNPEKDFDYSNLESWMGAVDFVDGKVPAIHASLSSPRGEKRYSIEVQNQEGILGADQVVEKNKLLYSVALTEAKLDRLGASKLAYEDEKSGKNKEMPVLELMDDVYPAISFQIDELNKVLEKVQEEALGDDKKEVSLQDILKKMGSKGMLKLIGATTILSLVLAACAPANKPVTVTPTVENRPTVTQPTAPPTQQAETPTPETGSVIPKEVTDRYPQGIDTEIVGSDNINLAKDRSTGNIIGWYSEIDGKWYFAAEGMQMTYVEDFEGHGPAIITEIAKTDDVTEKTVADWEAGIDVPKYSEFSIISSKNGDSQLFNLVLTNAVYENIKVHPNSEDSLSFDRIKYSFAYKSKDGSFHVVNLESRVWLDDSRSYKPQAINAGSFSKYCVVGGIYMVEIQYMLPEDTATVDDRIKGWSRSHQGLATQEEWEFFFQPYHPNGAVTRRTGQEIENKLNDGSTQPVTLDGIVIVQLRGGEDWQQAPIR